MKTELAAHIAQNLFPTTGEINKALFQSCLETAHEHDGIISTLSIEVIVSTFGGVTLKTNGSNPNIIFIGHLSNEVGEPDFVAEADATDLGEKLALDLDTAINIALFHFGEAMAVPFKVWPEYDGEFEPDRSEDDGKRLLGLLRAGPDSNDHGDHFPQTKVVIALEGTRVRLRLTDHTGPILVGVPVTFKPGKDEVILTDPGLKLLAQWKANEAS